MLQEIDLDNDSTQEVFNKLISNNKDIADSANQANSNISLLNTSITNKNRQIDSNISNIQNDISSIKTNIATAQTNITKNDNHINSLDIETEKLKKLASYSFDNIEDMKKPMYFFYGEVLKTKGYNSADDGGAAIYEVSQNQYDWSIELSNSEDIENRYYANIINTDFVNYKMFGAVLDGVTNDYMALNNTHKYCNQYKVLLKNNQGTIYKPDNNILEVNYNVDLNGSKIKIDSDTLKFYKISNSLSFFKGCELDIEGVPLEPSNFIIIASSGINISNFKICYSDTLLASDNHNFNLFNAKSVSNITFQNITETKSVIINSEDYIISISDSKNIIIRGLTSFTYLKGIELSNSSMILLENVYTHSLNLINSSSVFIEKCTFSNKSINVEAGSDYLSIKNSSFSQTLDSSNCSRSIIDLGILNGKLFNGSIYLENINIEKDDFDMNLINYTFKTGTGVSNNTKLPDLNLKNIIIKNNVSSTSKLFILNFSGTSDFATSESKLKKFRSINIDNISYLNSDNSEGSIIFISEKPLSDEFDCNTTSYINILNTAFLSDPITDTIISTSNTSLTLKEAVNNNISIDTESLIFNNSKLSLENVHATLVNNNNLSKVYINNSSLYAFSQPVTINEFTDTIINNSVLRVFDCDYSNNTCIIPKGSYVTCLFKTYKYMKPEDTLVNTCTISKDSQAKLLNTNI